MSINSNVCPVCKGGKYEILKTECGDRLHGYPGVWGINKCGDCGLSYTNPQVDKEDVVNYYPKTYAPYNFGRELRENILGKILRRIVMSPYYLRYGNPDVLIAPFGESRMLEIGCGSGSFLRKMSQIGWICSGIDISQFAVERSRKNMPTANISLSSLENYQSESKFDLVAMSHVLEHFSDPLESLKKSFNLLSKGGLIYIAVPNIDSLEARIFGKYWIGLDLPRHMVHFSENVISKQLRICGFDVLSIRPAMFATSLSESLIMLLPGWLRKSIFNSTVSKALYFMCIFPAALSYLLGNRPIIEVIARK